ncbi:cyclophilin-like fold protein [Streptococcus equinus]|uniref:cyclophilin-like fold protein n=1 Tax=Streptococcus equinus TaxID=1335 RepID=UPI003BF7AC80
MAFLVTIAGESFELILENNASAIALVKLLPLELDMADVNGNEKFYLLADHLPSHEQCSCSIKAGDLLLCQTNELTFFYDDCKTCFKYTYLGHVKDTMKFKKAMAGKKVTVVFEEK